MQDPVTEQEQPATANEVKEIDVSAELTCMLNGMLIGSATVLILNSTEEQDQELEDKTIAYLKAIVRSYILQGLTRDTLGFLWSQMGIAAKANTENNVQAVAHYLLGCVLEHGDMNEVEESSTVEKQS